MKKIFLYSAATILMLSSIPMLEVSATTIYSVDVENNASKVRIYNVKINQQNEQLILYGLIKRRSYNTHVLPGHIDYVVRDINDRIIMNGVIQTPGNLNLRRNRYPSQFKFLLPDELSEGSHIELSWHHK